uniref:L-aminoadipate-semialdehyde dehydrogenase-phosphopantetheinyl transferase n=1 Tax=Bos taurus TaxID=9913 RepID=F1MS62_BOVIN
AKAQSNYEGLLKLFNLVPLLSEPGPVIRTEPPAPQQQNPHFSPQGSGPGLANAETAPGSLDGLCTAPWLARSLGLRRGPCRSRRSEAGLGAGAGIGPEGPRGAQTSGVGCWGRQPGALETTPEAPRGALCHGSPLAPAQDERHGRPRPESPRLCGRRGRPWPGNEAGPRRSPGAPRSPTCTAVSEVSSPASPLPRPGCDWLPPLSRCLFFKSERPPVRAAPPSRPSRPRGPAPRAVTRCRRTQRTQSAEQGPGFRGGGGRADDAQRGPQAGRLMIRKLVAEKLNIPWNNIRLQRTAKGKPVLAKDSLNPYPNFNFNISHQGDYAVLAAESELQVGIDIMKTSFPGRGSIPEFFHIMKRKFTDKEWETIRSFKDEWTQLDMFYRNWALKESFIKAIGVGLGFELQRLEFDISPLNLDIGQVYKETRLFLDGEEEKEWAFEESKIDEHHFVAVALRKPNGSRHQNVTSQDDSKATQRQFTILTFNDLISSAVPMTPEDPSFWDCFCFTEEISIRNGTKS